MVGDACALHSRQRWDCRVGNINTHHENYRCSHNSKMDHFDSFITLLWCSTSSDSLVILVDDNLVILLDYLALPTYLCLNIAGGPTCHWRRSFCPIGSCGLHRARFGIYWNRAVVGFFRAWHCLQSTQLLFLTLFARPCWGTAWRGWSGIQGWSHVKPNQEDSDGIVPNR